MAQLAQLDGVLVPDQERSGAYFDTSRHNVDTLGLGTALDLLESGLVDYQADAAVEPSVFSPVFDLQASLIVRGESCHMDFGWYCIDHVPTSNTDQNFVPLVTADEVASYHDALRASTWLALLAFAALLRRRSRCREAASCRAPTPSTVRRLSSPATPLDCA